MIRALILFLLAFCPAAFSEEFYESYVQINPSTEEGKLFVLAMLSPLSGNDDDDDDRAVENFTLALGETQTKVFNNKFFPEREYVFKVEAWKNEYHKMGVTVNFIVKDKNIAVYASRQVVGAWKTFNKSKQQGPTAGTR